MLHSREDAKLGIALHCWHFRSCNVQVFHRAVKPMNAKI